MSSLIVYNQNIPYTPPVDATPIYQGWEFSPPNSLRFGFVQGLALPDPIDVAVKIKNYPALDINGTFESYHLAMQRSYEASNPTDADFIGVVSDLAELPTTYDLDQNNLEITLSVSIADAGFLSAGVYRGAIGIDVYGIVPGGSALQFIETLETRVSCIVVTAQGALIGPSTFSFSFTEALPLPAGKVVDLFCANVWRLEVPSYINVSSQSGSIVLESSADTSRVYRGTGSHELLVALSENARDLQIGTSVSVFYVRPENGPNRILYAYVNHLSDAQIVLEPESLDFVAVKGLSESDNQVVQISSAAAVSIEAPPWLLVQEDGVLNETLIVSVAASINFAPGVYSGAVKITSSSDQKELLVKYEVVEDVVFAVEQPFNFCQDEKEVSTFYALDNRSNAVLSLSAMMPVPELVTFEEENHKYDLAFFKNKVSFHIGDTIKRLFKALEDPHTNGILARILQNENLLLYYNAVASVDATIEITPVLSSVQPTLESYSQQLYLKGRRPLGGQEHFMILKPDTVPIRVTRKSKQLLNVLASDFAGLTVRQRLINGTIVSTDTLIQSPVVTDTLIQSPVRENQVIARALYFSSRDVGDVVKLRVEDTVNNTHVAQDYIIFPDAAQSVHVMWVTEHNVFEIYEFTGEFVVDTVYEHLLVKTYNEVVTQLQKLDVDRELSASLNTGWTLKSNQVLLDQIGFSKKAWIMFEDATEPIEVIPVPTELLNESSSQGLYSYTLTFKINPNNALRNYTS